MFSLNKQVLVVSLGFSESLETKCVSLNDEPCMVRPTLIALYLLEVTYYPFMVSLDKSNGKF